jgi:hypothetical protein
MVGEYKAKVQWASNALADGTNVCVNPQTAIRTATTTKKATGDFLSCGL